ncbi:unnamed protein product [Amoebophrya sp. A25]|nr:unnamed protein product [Amoebophrya sp. A25]|eukprot:GSA25T00016357001.1
MGREARTTTGHLAVSCLVGGSRTILLVPKAVLGTTTTATLLLVLFGGFFTGEITPAYGRASYLTGGPSSGPNVEDHDHVVLATLDADGTEATEPTVEDEDDEPSSAAVTTTSQVDAHQGVEEIPYGVSGLCHGVANERGGNCCGPIVALLGARCAASGITLASGRTRGRGSATTPAQQVAVEHQDQEDFATALSHQSQGAPTVDCRRRVRACRDQSDQSQEQGQRQNQGQQLSVVLRKGAHDDQEHVVEGPTSTEVAHHPQVEAPHQHRVENKKRAGLMDDKNHKKYGQSEVDMYQQIQTEQRWGQMCQILKNDVVRGQGFPLFSGILVTYWLGQAGCVGTGAFAHGVVKLGVYLPVIFLFWFIRAALLWTDPKAALLEEQFAALRKKVDRLKILRYQIKTWRDGSRGWFDAFLLEEDEDVRTGEYFAQQALQQLVCSAPSTAASSASTMGATGSNRATVKGEGEPQQEPRSCTSTGGPDVVESGGTSDADAEAGGAGCGAWRPGEWCAGPTGSHQPTEPTVATTTHVFGEQEDGSSRSPFRTAVVYTAGEFDNVVVAADGGSRDGRHNESGGRDLAAGDRSTKRTHRAGGASSSTGPHQSNNNKNASGKSLFGGRSALFLARTKSKLSVGAGAGASLRGRNEDDTGKMRRSHFDDLRHVRELRRSRKQLQQSRGQNRLSPKSALRLRYTRSDIGSAASSATALALEERRLGRVGSGAKGAAEAAGSLTSHAAPERSSSSSSGGPLVYSAGALVTSQSQEEPMVGGGGIKEDEQDHLDLGHEEPCSNMGPSTALLRLQRKSRSAALAQLETFRGQAESLAALLTAHDTLADEVKRDFRLLLSLASEARSRSCQETLLETLLEEGDEDSLRAEMLQRRREHFQGIQHENTSGGKQEQTSGAPLLHGRARSTTTRGAASTVTPHFGAELSRTGSRASSTSVFSGGASTMYGKPAPRTPTGSSVASSSVCIDQHILPDPAPEGDIELGRFFAGSSQLASGQQADNVLALEEAEEMSEGNSFLLDLAAQRCRQVKTRTQVCNVVLAILRLIFCLPACGDAQGANACGCCACGVPSCCGGSKGSCCLASLCCPWRAGCCRRRKQAETDTGDESEVQTQVEQGRSGRCCNNKSSKSSKCCFPCCRRRSSRDSDSEECENSDRCNHAKEVERRGQPPKSGHGRGGRCGGQTLLDVSPLELSELLYEGCEELEMWAGREADLSELAHSRADETVENLRQAMAQLQINAQ